MNPPKSESTTQLKNRRILVIDDQEGIREDFLKVLSSHSDSDSPSGARSAFFGEEDEAVFDMCFELTTAGQGLEGIELFKSAQAEGRPFAMAFVDVRMPPGIDGVQTIKGLWEVDPDLHVVICTAYSDYSFEEILGELGESDRLLILKKPFDPVEVRQLAGALTEKCHMVERVNAQLEELRIANAKAESANRAKSEFLANMSHEIRTPMNAVLGYVDLMCDPNASVDDRGRYGQTVRRSGEHLLTILNDILDVSRIEASRLVINAADFSPFDLTREVTSMLLSTASEKDLELRLEVATPIPQVIESDLVRVRQILLNLIGNAIKFTPEGTIRVVLRLDDNEASTHRYISIDVIDSGIGIAEEDQEAIFEAFRQEDNSGTRSYGGTGLGLTICKRLAILLGGDVSVKSDKGAGSTFSLRLYAGELSRSMLREYTPEECAIGVALEEPRAKQREDIRLEGRVLIAEDVKFNQLLACALMRRAGATVEVVENGKQAMDLALAAEGTPEAFDLILMDMQMPVMDGYDATRGLRAAQFEKPIVALTARAMVGDRERCIEVGCDDYATKPFDRMSLLMLCARLMADQRTPSALPSANRDLAPRD